MSACLRILAALFAYRSHATDERGATATEYGVLMGFLAFALVLGVTAFGEQLALLYQDLAARVP